MNSQGFDEFYKRTFARVLAASILACGHRGDAEDGVQDAFLIAFDRWDYVSGLEAPEAWVKKVAIRQAVRAARKSRRDGDEFLRVAVPPQATVEETAQAREVLAALAALPASDRVPLVACTLYDWDQQEAARLVGVPRGTIARRIHDARAVLKVRLGMVGKLGSARDSLVPAPQVVLAQFAARDDDPVAALLGRTERWLRDGIEAEPGTAERMLAEIRADTAGGAAPPAERRPSWWRAVPRAARRVLALPRRRRAAGRDG
jgi:RNA polymerase sigma-70 factor (ECF subfamily)